jgi:undecaprenyl-diphosphatase
LEIFQAFILGMVQGLTEFLPISSSAHLILVRWFCGWRDSGLAFDVFLHLGTLTALLIYFFREVFEVVRGGVSSILERRIGFERDRILFWLLVIGTIPAVVAGLLFSHQAETVFREAHLLIAATLAFVGFVIAWVDGRYPTLRQFDELTFQEAFVIGIAQAFAIIPGVSRSGATMGMARRLGFQREAAARFSFLLSVPIIFGALVFESKKLFEELGQSIEWGYILTGFFSSFFFGVCAIHFMLLYVRNADLMKFTYYRVALAVVIVFWSLWKS